MRCVDHADYTTPTLQHELHHTDHTDHADHTDQECIYLSVRSRSLTAVKIDYP